MILNYKNNPPGALNQSFKTTNGISYTDLNDVLFYLVIVRANVPRLK